MASIRRPSYDLHAILELVGHGEYETTREAEIGMEDLGLSSDDLETCILGLTPSEFHKPMPAEQRPQLLQDVYRPRYDDVPIYLKLQLVGTLDLQRYPQGRFVQVISFKRK
ncbi:MAG: type II toxin-antitoxin system MqsR family toxin [Gemmatimonadaceae bacterium]